MRVLITTFGTLGDLDPYLALGRGLAERGHAPVIATHEYYRDMIEAADIGFHPVRPDAHPEDRTAFARAMSPRLGSKYVLRDLVIPYLRDSWEDTARAAREADLVVTHPLTFAGPIVAEEGRLPWVSTVLAPISFFSRHDFPVVPPFPHAWRLYGVPGVPGLLIRLFRAITHSWTAPIRELRAERGLPPGGDPLYEGQHSPLLTLALFSPVLAAPQPDWPPSARLTGFLFRDGPAAGALDAELEAFLEAGPAPIVFTLGTSAVAVAGSFYEESLLAARRLGMRAVLMVGDDPGNLPVSPLGEDAIAVVRAPHAALFPRAAVVVHHGGIGTLGQALRAGRPMVVVPWSHDQPDNALRARRLEVAAILSPRRYGADRAARAIGRQLGDPAFAARAAEIGAVVRAEDGVRTACEAIEEAALAHRAPAPDD
ncbi:MAG TPA: glycosyltransferase [Gemmatimonadota bacterium]|nr:glycosyltransferase [Gemmatimonadota bacterium]